MASGCLKWIQKRVEKGVQKGVYKRVELAYLQAPQGAQRSICQNAAKLHTFKPRRELSEAYVKMRRTP